MATPRAIAAAPLDAGLAEPSATIADTSIGAAPPDASRAEPSVTTADTSIDTAWLDAGLAEPSTSIADTSIVAAARALAMRRDTPWLAGAALALVALCGLPYLLSALFGPADLERIGTFWFMRDFSQYEAAMLEGASQSGWLIHDHFSAEPHTAALMYPLYVGAGKLAAFLGVPNVSVFVALEWLGRLAVLGAVYAFAAEFVADARTRRLVVALALGTLGLDTIAAILRAAFDAAGLGVVAAALPDTINPYLEVSSFGALLSAPHLMLGLALTLACAPLYLRAIQPRPLQPRALADSAIQRRVVAVGAIEPRAVAASAIEPRAAELDASDLYRDGLADARGRMPWRWLALLGVTVFVLSLVHSFNTPVLVSVLLAHAALSGRRAWPAAAIAALAAAPMALYSVVLYQTDPFWSGTYSAQNLMPSPAPWLLPLDFGVVLLAAPLAWPIVRRWPMQRRTLILLWIALGLVWMYAPVPYQRRFAFGVQPALAVLAAVGLLQLQPWMRERRLPRWRVRAVNYAVIVAALSTSVLVYFALVASSISNKPAEVYLWSRPEAVAAAWLGAHSTAADVVLASTEFANPLVGEIDGRVVHGHIVATLNSDAKKAQVQAFFSSEATPAQRSSILAASGATIVAFGPRERALGATELSDQPDLALLYDREGVQLFRVLT